MQNFFFNRDSYIQILSKRLNDFIKGYRQNLAFIGKEMVGKTSIILHFFNRFYDFRIIPIYVLIRKNDFESFAKQFIGSLLYNFLLNSGILLKEDFEFLIDKSSKYIPKTVDKIKNIVALLERKRKGDVFMELLSLCDTINQETGRFCVVIFDEFHNLETMGIKNLYKDWAKNLILQKNTMFIIISSSSYKSRKILMDNLSLLFGKFEVIEIEPFDFETSREFLELKLGRISIDKDIQNFLINLSGGIPFYLDTIASSICKMKSQDILDNSVEKELIWNALEELFIEEIGTLNQRFYNYLKDLQEQGIDKESIKLLIYLYEGYNKLKDISMIMRKEKNKILKSFNYLLELGVVNKNGDFFKINDRMFNIWLKFVYEKRVSVLNWTEQALKDSFRKELDRLYNEFITSAHKDVSERIRELMSLFENECVYIDRKKIKLINFREIKPLKFNALPFKDGLIGRSTDSVWLIAIKDGLITEEDIVNFSDECKKFRYKSKRKIMISSNRIDTNVKLKAMEEKVLAWDIKNINLLFELFNRPLIVI
ncbi:MAG: hypothetical protein NC900_02315 [Candidatus Omnitrophica bacterium]|nr:hypothetical protein [Candidatus Omnitrophota bacterium]